MRRLLLLPVLLLACVGARPVSGPARRAPNVVVVLADDQGWGDLSLTGNANLRTPNIDALARAGVSFDRFYVCPVCSPTRAEFLTGRYHPRGGVYSTSAGGERLDLDEMTIAETFKAAGYATAAFGKWHNGMQPPYHPNARGFDEFYGFCSGHWGNYFSPMLEHNGRIVRGEGFIIDDLTNRAMRFIEERKGRPFFAYLAYNTPHSPMQVPDRWWDRFKEKDLGMRNRDPKREKVEHTRAALAMCENIDWNVGRLVAKLDALEISDDTILVYFSDNGPNGWRWNGGMKGRKGSTDEGGVRSPLVIRWPGKVAGGRKIPQIAAAIDLLPTLADLSGIEVRSQKPLDGVSLKGLLVEGGPAPSADRMIFSTWRGRVSVRTQRYRLDNKGALFDMAKDPGQDKDISKAQPEVAARLRAAARKWKEEVIGKGPDLDRPFPVGHPAFPFTQLPARDAKAEGGIRRSNRFPNCSYFTGWTRLEGRIVWDVEVLKEGAYEAVVYYGCPKEDVGATIELSLGAGKVTGKVAEAHDPPEKGAEHDRTPRMESYVKDFKPLKLGKIRLEKGRGEMILKALEMPGKQVMEFRLVMLTRVEE